MVANAATCWPPGPDIPVPVSAAPCQRAEPDENRVSAEPRARGVAHLFCFAFALLPAAAQPQTGRKKEMVKKPAPNASSAVLREPNPTTTRRQCRTHSPPSRRRRRAIAPAPPASPGTLLKHDESESPMALWQDYGTVKGPTDKYSSYSV